MNKIGIVGFFAIVVGIATLISFMGGFKTAGVVGTQPSYLKTICPSTIYSSFDIILKNVGERNTVTCLTASSNDINISKESTCYTLEYDRQSGSTFSINIDANSLPSNKESANITINFSYLYEKGGIFNSEINITGFCKYEKQEYEDLRLVI